MDKEALMDSRIALLIVHARIAELHRDAENERRGTTVGHAPRRGRFTATAARALVGRSAQAA
jgi:hypothetical protein